MNTATFLAIDTSDLSEDEILHFIHSMNKSIYSGKGRTPEFCSKLNLNVVSPLRFLLGCDLTHGQRKFVEAVWSCSFKTPLSPSPIKWISSPNWLPANLNKTNASIESSKLDIEFILKFGISIAAWEEHVFLSKGSFQRVEKETIGSSEMIRLYAALAVFGFLEPEQFFCHS